MTACVQTVAGGLGVGRDRLGWEELTRDRQGTSSPGFLPEGRELRPREAPAERSLLPRLPPGKFCCVPAEVRFQVRTDDPAASCRLPCPHTAGDAQESKTLHQQGGAPGRNTRALRGTWPPTACPSRSPGACPAGQVQPALYEKFRQNTAMPIQDILSTAAYSLEQWS